MLTSLQSLLSGSSCKRKVDFLLLPHITAPCETDPVPEWCKLQLVGLLQNVFHMIFDNHCYYSIFNKICKKRISTKFLFGIFSSGVYPPYLHILQLSGLQLNFPLWKQGCNDYISPWSRARKMAPFLISIIKFDLPHPPWPDKNSV